MRLRSLESAFALAEDVTSSINFEPTDGHRDFAGCRLKWRLDTRTQSEMFQLDIDNDGAQTLLDRASSAYKEARQRYNGHVDSPSG